MLPKRNMKVLVGSLQPSVGARRERLRSAAMAAKKRAKAKAASAAAAVDAIASNNAITLERLADTVNASLEAKKATREARSNPFEAD